MTVSLQLFIAQMLHVIVTCQLQMQYHVKHQHYVGVTTMQQLISE